MPSFISNQSNYQFFCSFLSLHPSAPVICLYVEKTAFFESCVVVKGLLPLPRKFTDQGHEMKGFRTQSSLQPAANIFTFWGIRHKLCLFESLFRPAGKEAEKPQLVQTLSPVFPFDQGRLPKR